MYLDIDLGDYQQGVVLYTVASAGKHIWPWAQYTIGEPNLRIKSRYHGAP